MKNLLKLVAATALTLTTVNAAALDNEIEITGAITSTVVVGIAPTNGEVAAADRFVAADIALGSIIAGGTFTPALNDFYVQTNSATGVSITLTDALNGGSLKHTVAADTIPVVYDIGGATYTLGTTVELVAGVNTGAVAAKSFTITPAATLGTETEGTYTTTLDVVVTAQ